jgi:plasmid stability protein
MASITIRNMEEPLKARLRVRAAHHGRSMEDEARHILRAALTDDRPPSLNLADSIQRRFASLGGFDLPDPIREPLREPPGFEE